MKIIFSKVNELMAKNDEDGTTSGFKKTPLILKNFFFKKIALNDKSMTWINQSHEDGVRTVPIHQSVQLCAG